MRDRRLLYFDPVYAVLFRIMPVLFNRQGILAMRCAAGFQQLEAGIRIRIGDYNRRYRAVACIQNGLLIKAADQITLFERVALLDVDGKRRTVQLYGVDTQMDEQLTALRRGQAVIRIKCE